nr:topless-related protein 4-like isoform X2 [Ipomoea batatas]
MSSSDRDLLFILLQFLEEEGFKESARKLEEESGVFFNMLHFEELVKKGEWDEVEKYLLGFTSLDENRFSKEVFFQIRKQKYLEAIDRKDIKKAINILNSELEVFAREDNGLYKEMAMLLTLENIREPESERNKMIDKLKNAIESNPAFHDALNSPAVEASRLRVLINQSLNWQHHHCQKPNPKPEIMTLLVDHRCEESQLNGGQVNNMPVNILHVGYGNQSQGQSSGSSDDIPMTVVMTLNQGSAVRSMDFHPVQHSLLLVGTSIGEIMIWELRTRTRLAKRSFEIWDHRACTLGLQTALRNDPPASVNRVMWSPRGSVFVVAYSKGLVHVYTYYGNLRNYLEIVAHEGSVNDIAFKNLNYRLYIITCGEDKLIKMWDASTGTKKYTFEGHESSVCSVCPHQIGNIQFFFSVATDGKIKVWPYFDRICAADYPAQGTTMLCSSDGKRLFSSGTDMEGVSYLRELNDNSVTIKREYIGLGGQTTETVKFDTAKNRFLAAGDDFTVKFWEMDNENLYTTTDAGGALPARPCLRFNKEGNLLAVSTSENGIKILVNADGFRLLQA